MAPIQHGKLGSAKSWTIALGNLTSGFEAEAIKEVLLVVSIGPPSHGPTHSLARNQNFIFTFLFIFFVRDRVSLCNPGCP